MSAETRPKRADRWQPHNPLTGPLEHWRSAMSTTQNARRFTLKTLSAAAVAVTLGGLSSLPAHAQETIKVGVLHSLSGTMAISETVLKDTVLM
eukprot:gene39903-52677_t